MTRRDVLWLTPDKPENISVGRRMIAEHLGDDGFNVTLRGTTPRTAARAMSEARRYDVLVGTTRAGAFAAVACATVHRLPLVIDHVDPIRQFEATHGPALSAAVRSAENAAFRLADHVLYVYDEEERRVRRRASATKTALGLEYERFASPPDSVVEAAREELAERGVDDHVLIYVGGLEPIYRISTLLAAVDYLDGWTLVLIGTGSLEDLVRRHGARRDDVEYLGVVPHEEVPGYLRAADVGASLVDDPHTLKILEYGAAGLPVVQAAGRAERRFDDMVTFCEVTPESVAGAVVTASERGPSDRLRSFVERFDWSEIARTYGEALDSVLASSKA